MRKSHSTRSLRAYERSTAHGTMPVMLFL